MVGANRKQQNDLRYLFMRGLIEHEKNQRSRHYLKSAAECTSRAVVSLELSPDPLTSVKSAKRLEGIGGETCTRLAKLDEAREFSGLKPLGCRFVSSAGAILVALLELNQEIMTAGGNKGKDILIQENKVKEKAKSMCEEQFTEGEEAFCVAWWRLEVLIKRGLIKRRSQKKKSVLQLLPAGKEIAQKLAGSDLSTKYKTVTSNILDAQKDGRTSPDAICHEVTNIQRQNSPSLFTSDNGEDGVVLLVDTQEMGGVRAGLGELCQLLDHHGVCYKTKKLLTGDYGWILRSENSEIALPCLAERKRADDIPGTLKEGRFWSQINRMLEWKRGFTERDVDCHLHYILERKPEEYVVKCTDGCQAIGKCGNPTLGQIKAVIDDLKHHPELLVKETDSLEITAVLLKSLTSELKERANKGEFDTLFGEVTQQRDGKVKEETVKTGADTYQNESSTELTYEEQLRIALANSLENIHDQQVADSKCTATGKKTRFEVQQDNQRPSTSNMFTNDTSTFSKFDSSDQCVKEPPQPESPLMQYHCTVESSVTCQSRSAETTSGERENKYCPTINRKRPHNISQTSQQGHDTTTTNSVSSSKKSRSDISGNCLTTKMIGVDHLNDVQPEKCLGSKLTVKVTKTDCDRGMDKTDDILESLRTDYYLKSQKQIEAISVSDDEFEETPDTKSKPKWKPIRLNLSPSKKFLETNIVGVKTEACVKKKGKGKLTKQCKSENLCGSFKDNIINQSIKHRNEDKIDHLSHIKSVHQETSLNESTNTYTTKQSDKIDNKSANSTEDIFVDRSYLNNKVNTTESVSQTFDDLLTPLDTENKVGQWLLNSSETVTKTATVVQISDISVHAMDEDSNESLPDIVTMKEPSDLKCTDVNGTDGVVIVSEDGICGNSKGRSNKTKRKGRQGHDSGYDSGDVRIKPGNSSHGLGDLAFNTSVINVDDAKIDTVLGILPHLERNRVVLAMKRCGFNVEQCISVLLDGDNTGECDEPLIDLTD